MPESIAARHVKDTLLGQSKGMRTLTMLTCLMLAAMPSLAAPRLLVIAHRGASGERPEHTIEAYRLAIAQGADFIEPDLVPTRDGILIARHENSLSGSTNVADKPEFAERLTRKQVDGVWVEDWFSEDFSLAEIRQLRARETKPNERPANVAFNDQFSIPTFAEIIDLAREESGRLGRPIGLYPETKHPTFFLHEGRHFDGEPIAQDTSAMLLDDLVASEFTDPKRVFIQSFELANLLQLKRVLMPRSGVAFPLVFLVGDVSGGTRPEDSNFGQPYDLVWNAQRAEMLPEIYDSLASVVPNFGAATGYTDLMTREALAALRTDVDALGLWSAAVLGVTPAPYGALDPRPRLGRLAPWLAEAIALDFGVHVYTVRKEPSFLFVDAQGRVQSAQELIAALADAGVEGVFADQPGLAAEVRDARAAAQEPAAH